MLSTVASAGPSMLVDSRAWGSTETPTLGRGYSPSTNTFRSVCLESAPGTEPTYDFSYEFIQVEDEAEALSKLDTPWSRAFVLDRMTAFDRLAASSRQYARDILIRLDVSTYYASVDESRTALSASAREILRTQGVPAFFTACGSAYVRGITRSSQLVSVLTYIQGSPARDAKVEAVLRTQLLSGPGSAAEKRELPGRKQLTISSQAWGLGRGAGVSLVSYDVPTFKRAVREAFDAMNGPMAGRVASVETVPWVENPDFLAQIRIEDRDVVNGAAIPAPLKKDILTSNAELLVEAQDAARARLDTFYRARLCRAALHDRWGGADESQLVEEATTVRLRNHRTGRPTRTVAQVEAALAGPRLDQLWARYADLASGDGEATVARCTADLLGGEAGTRGLFLRRHGEVRSCAALQKKLSPEVNTDVDDYCPPEVL